VFHYLRFLQQLHDVIFQLVFLVFVGGVLFVVQLYLFFFFTFQPLLFTYFRELSFDVRVGVKRRSLSFFGAQPARAI